MTVEKLIKELQKIADKTKDIQFADDLSEATFDLRYVQDGGGMVLIGGSEEGFDA